MSQLPTCPRCRAYVQPDWPSCKICGFHPDDPLTHGPILPPERVKRRLDILGALYGFAVFVVLVGLSVGAARLGIYAWQHHNLPSDRQEFVMIPKG